MTRPWTALAKLLRRSIAAKYVLILVAVAAVIGSFGGYAYVYTGEELADETESKLTSTAELEADRLDEWLTGKIIAMDAIADSAAFQGDDRGQINQRLYEIAERDPDVAAIYYVDTGTGDVITSTGDARVVSAESVLTRSGQSRIATLDGHLRDEVTLSEPFRPFEGSAPIVLIRTGVPNRESRAIVAAFNLDDLSESQAHQLTESYATVVNTSGTVIMAENGSRILRADSIDRARFENDSGFVHAENDEGEAIAVGYAAMETQDWVVTTRMKQQDAYALQSTVTRQFLWLLAVVLAGAGLVGLTIGRDVVVSIRDLAQSSRALREGDLDTEVDTARVDELGELYHAFDEMRVSLKAEIDHARASRRSAIEAREAAERARAESERLRLHLERTAERYGEVMAQCADGDLERRVDVESESRAMVTVGESFNEMMDDVQAANERMEAFATVLSHDLRNPLTVALGRAEMLGEESDSPHVEPLERSLERMRDIIADALVLARDSNVEEVCRLDLDSQARRAWAQVETGAATLAVDADRDVDADPNLLAHVFENLFRNAVEHGGPEVTVRVCDTQNGFAIEDDGPGIPPAERDAVFETGYTTNRGGGGTGFGLTIVERIVDAHGWGVSVGQSETGGARFEFDTESGPCSDVVGANGESGAR